MHPVAARAAFGLSPVDALGVRSEEGVALRATFLMDPHGACALVGIAPKTYRYVSKRGDEKLYRLYREERLTVRKRGGRKRALGTRRPMMVPQGVNQRWALDFASDPLSWGRRFRILCVVDDFT